MAALIDVNRGVMIKKHPAGFMVYMYLDKPGVFLNAFAKPVSDLVAKQAGYDTDALGRQRIRMERMTQAQKAIDAEMELAEADGDETVLFRRGEYKAVQMPLGRVKIYDEDNNAITPMPIPTEEGKKLLEYLVPGEPMPEVEEDASETKDEAGGRAGASKAEKSKAGPG